MGWGGEGEGVRLVEGHHTWKVSPIGDASHRGHQYLESGIVHDGKLANRLDLIPAMGPLLEFCRHLMESRPENMYRSMLSNVILAILTGYYNSPKIAAFWYIHCSQCDSIKGTLYEKFFCLFHSIQFNFLLVS